MARKGKPVETVDPDLAKTASRPSGAYLVILEAGERVIVAKGFARATIEEIARAANVSADVFYAHFPGKGALLRALNERFAGKVITAIDHATRSGSWSNARSSDLIDVAVHSVIDIVIEHAPLVRAFLAHGATDRSLAEGLKKIGTHLTQRLVASLAECTDAPTVDPRPIAFALTLAVSLAHHMVLVGDAWSGRTFSREELGREAARAVSAYLALSAPPA